MTRRLVLFLAVVLAPMLATAQETPGAERIEVSTALFGGGLIIVPSATPGADASRSYVLSGAVARNLNHWIGLEADLGVALGKSESHAMFGVTPSNIRTPNVLLYSGNVIFNPLKSDRPFVPYVSGGVGGMSVFGGEETVEFALNPNTTYLTGSVGGGARWFPIRHWGVRGDYRYVGIANDRANVEAQRIVRSAHRLYGALIMTF